jgi:cytochrome c peroxidase
MPGCSDIVVAGARRLCASPLFDAWVELGEGLEAKPAVHPARAPQAGDPEPLERLGEALFFTTLMAPDATSEGRSSRFTCETCHFEGATDGRVHNSGRNEIRVSTRSLLGLFNDAPYFSRARDPDLTSVSHHEFAVANRGNPVDPWFSLDTVRFPWLSSLGLERRELSPLELRGALLRFLARFSPEENPFVAQRSAAARFSAEERRGAELFREHCAGCHAARLVANAPATLVPFERWEALIFSPATPIVWARGEYEQTGVLPYVDPEGTRVPSLRRLYAKRPYFTNGTARTLGDVLERARSGRRFFHAEPVSPPEDARALTAEERGGLIAFLRLL